MVTTVPSSTLVPSVGVCAKTSPSSTSEFGMLRTRGTSPGRRCSLRRSPPGCRRRREPRRARCPRSAIVAEEEPARGWRARERRRSRAARATAAAAGVGGSYGGGGQPRRATWVTRSRRRTVEAPARTIVAASAVSADAAAVRDRLEVGVHGGGRLVAVGRLLREGGRRRGRGRRGPRAAGRTAARRSLAEVLHRDLDGAVAGERHLRR